MTFEEFVTSAPSRRETLKNRLIKESKSAKQHILQAVHQKTQEEVKGGTMGPPMSEDEVTAKHGPYWNAVQRFGIEQGLKEDGTPKIRCIDNHATAGTNGAAQRRQKIPMASESPCTEAHEWSKPHPATEHGCATTSPATDGVKRSDTGSAQQYARGCCRQRPHYLCARRQSSPSVGGT